MTAATSPAAEIARYDAVGQAELVRHGEVSRRELTGWAIERIEELNPALNAVITPMFAEAASAAAAPPAGQGPAGPLAGVPYLLKDLITEVAGTRFTEGSRFLRDNVSRFDSELVVRLRRAGLIFVGKTSTPEFGMVPTCEPVLFGPARNPWDPGISTSGSSGGSAAAVASGMVPAAHGNDAGGSLRYPASACGLFALKPTRARNPLGPEYGDALGGWAVEHALTRTVRDSAALLDATAGPAPGDPYWAPPPRRPFAAEVGADPGRLRIGFSTRTADGSPAHPDCLAALDDAARLCGELGHEVVTADFTGLTPEVGAAIGTVYQAATAWIMRYWIRRLRREPGPDDLEPQTRALWEGGERVTAGEYLLAIEDLQAFARMVAGFLVGIDVWLTPTMSTLPLAIGEIVSPPQQPLRALERGAITVAYAGVIANITGNPAMSVPLWWNSDGLPVGVHFLGRFGDEATLFRLGSQLEAARPWIQRIPPVAAGATPAGNSSSHD
jgi:amidase